MIDDLTDSTEDESTQLLYLSATRVWQDLYVHKKPVSWTDSSMTYTGEGIWACWLGGVWLNSGK